MNDRARTARTAQGSSLTSRVARGLPVLCFVAMWLFLAGMAEARIYKYVDEAGDSHYTDSIQQIPMEYRHQVRDISPEMEDLTGFRVVEGLNGDAGPSEDEGFAPELDSDFAAADMSDGGEMLAGVLESLGFGIILLIVLAIPVLYVISALVFRLACSLAGEDPPGLGRACAILLAQGLAGSVVGGAVGGIAGAMGINESASLGASLAVGGASTMLSWMVNAAILASMMSYGFLKSMWIGFLHNLLAIVIVGGPIAVLVFIGFLLG